MGFEKDYTRIFDYLYDTLSAMPNEIKQVIYKESSNKFALQRWPCALINPGRFTMDPADTFRIADVGNYTLDIRGEIIIIIREVDSEDWFPEMMTSIGAVVDAIFADQTLGGTCFMAWPSAGGPGEITVQNTLYYGGVISIRALKQYP